MEEEALLFKGNWGDGEGKEWSDAGLKVTNACPLPCRQGSFVLWRRIGA